jgi:bifunctional polynucleotide phosphatase/kinase
MKRNGEPQQKTLHKYFKLKEYIEWSKNRSVLIGKFKEPKITPKIAGFDFDGTIASYNGAYHYPKDGNDWKWFHSSVPAVLAHLAAAGYTIVLLSNQKGLEATKSNKRKLIFQGRIEKTVKEFEKYCESIQIEPPPILVLAAIEDDCFRKPRTGMWFMLQSMFPDVKLSVELSFYCGDAAGRDYVPEGAHFEDHADTDRKWALNLGMDFYVPHQLFNDLSAEKYKESNSELHIHDNPYLPPLEFDPREFQHQFTIPELHSFDLIICVGSPASGKSHFCATHLKDFIIVNQDTLRTKSACIKYASKALDSGMKVVIDNTNPRKETRQEYIRLAPSKRIACLWFTSPFHLCSHNNSFREHSMAIQAVQENQDRFPLGKHVPPIAMHSFWKNIEDPTLEEGFESIIEIPFAPFFNDPKQEALWRQFYN